MFVFTRFSGASLTATGAASLASGLQECPHITDIKYIFCSARLAYCSIIQMLLIMLSLKFLLIFLLGGFFSVSDNNLRDEGISRIAEIFTKLQNLSNVA